jgi:hypothetical protein
LLGAAIACLIRVLLYRRNVYIFVKHHSELIAIFLKKLEKKYMRKIVQKNEVSIMKLSTRRGLECRILHHLS